MNRRYKIIRNSELNGIEKIPQPKKYRITIPGSRLSEQIGRELSRLHGSSDFAPFERLALAVFAGPGGELPSRTSCNLSPETDNFLKNLERASQCHAFLTNGATGILRVLLKGGTTTPVEKRVKFLTDYELVRQAVIDGMPLSHRVLNSNDRSLWEALLYNITGINRLTVLKVQRVDGNTALHDAAQLPTNEKAAFLLDTLNKAQAHELIFMRNEAQKTPYELASPAVKRVFDGILRAQPAAGGSYGYAGPN